MSKAPPEVKPSVELIGTNDANVLLATESSLSTNPWFYDHTSFFVSALGGDDGIVRDRTGYYFGADDYFGHGFIDGGAGLDVISYAGADGPIIARLDWSVNVDGANHIVPGEFAFIRQSLLPNPEENGWIRGFDLVQNVEGVAGTAFDDEIHGNVEVNRLWGHDGDDVIHGRAGSDSIYGGLGDDYLSGGDDADYIEGGDGDDYIHGGKGNDTIHGGDGDDEIHGHDGADLIYAGDGDDYIRGGAGNDVIHGGDGSNELYGDAGNDTVHLGGFGWNQIDGGSGTDTVVFTQQAVVNLYSGFAWRSQGLDGTDTIGNVENVTTGKHDDVVVADDARNVIRTNGGDDWIMALDADDDIKAGEGDDTVFGGDGDDHIVGGRGADRIRGGEGADTIYLGRVGRSDTDRDVLVWDAGDLGLDVVRGFSVAHDRLNFSQGFLAVGPQVDNLLVFFEGSDAMLAANVAGHGWDFVARFKGVNAITLGDAIDSGAIFDVELSDVGDGAPGDFADPDPAEIGIGVTFLF